MKKLGLLLISAAASMTLASCSAVATATTSDLLPLPEVDTAQGLVIDGQEIASKELYEAALDSDVSIFSGMSYEAEELTIQRFIEETGIKAEFTRMPSNKLLERALSEAGADRLSADIIRTTDMKAADILAEENVLVEYKTPFDEELRKAGAIFNDGKVTSSFYSVYAFAYNSRALDEAHQPKEWKDLLDPALNDKIGIVKVGAGSYNLALMDSLINKFGEGYLSELGELNPRVYDSASVQIEALTRGEIDVATLGLNNGVALAHAGAPVEIVVPQDASSGSFTPLGLTSEGAENPAAQVFMNWQMSKAGQSFAAAQGFAPSIPGLGDLKAGEHSLPQPGDEGFSIFTPQDMAERKESVTETWTAAFK